MMADLKSGQAIVESDSDREFPVSDVNEKALLRKLDARLLPPLTLLYLLSFLDRSNGEPLQINKPP